MTDDGEGVALSVAAEGVGQAGAQLLDGEAARVSSAARDIRKERPGSSSA
jgi:hypothetical protein